MTRQDFLRNAGAGLMAAELAGASSGKQKPAAATAPVHFTPQGGLTRRYNDSIRGLAAEFDCILADVWASEGLADWVIHCDDVPANKVGQILIANRIFDAIAQHASGLTKWMFEQERDTPWIQMTTKKRIEVGDPFQHIW